MNTCLTSAVIIIYVICLKTNSRIRNKSLILKWDDARLVFWSEMMRGSYFEVRWCEARILKWDDARLVFWSEMMRGLYFEVRWCEACILKWGAAALPGRFEGNWQPILKEKWPHRVTVATYGRVKATIKYWK